VRWLPEIVAVSLAVGAALGAWATSSEPPKVVTESHVLRQIELRIVDACVGDKHGPSWRPSIANYECREVRRKP
jgi:hypothetical protein